MHEAGERQKFISEAQYLRDMQHKADSDYQACLRRQDHKRGTTEKKRDQFWEQETSIERSRFSSGSSSKQSPEEEDPLAEPRLSPKTSSSKSDPKLPAIDQTSVKQKHKSTMTGTKPEKVGPSRPSPAVRAPQLLSKKRRPNLGRMTVSPERQSPRVSGEGSRQKSQLRARTMALPGTDPGVTQEGPEWASATKLQRPTRERRLVVAASRLTRTTENTSEGAEGRGQGALSQREPPSALSQVIQGANSPQRPSESLSPPVTSTSAGGPRQTPFRFRDEDFYSVLSPSTGGDDDGTEEETHFEEELLLSSMRPPHSPPNRKRSRFLGKLDTQPPNKTFEGDPERCRADPFRSAHGRSSLRGRNARPAEQRSLGQRRCPEPEWGDGESDGEPDSSDSECKRKSSHSRASKAEPRPGDGRSAANGPQSHDYEGEWLDYLDGPPNSLDCLLSNRPPAPRSSANSSLSAPGSLTRPARRDGLAVDLSVSVSSVHSSDAEGSSRFNGRRPLSPIRHRTPVPSAELHSNFPVNSARELDGRGAEANTLTSQPQGAPLSAETLLRNSQGGLSAVDSSSASPPRMNLAGQVPMPGPLQENRPFTLVALSDLADHRGHGNRMAAPGLPAEKTAEKVKADPEKLKKLQESLLEEDSEEEGDLCRICQIAGGSPANPLLEPCSCVGSLRFVHHECLKKWLQVKITSGADLGAVQTCEMCKQALLVDREDFNLTEFYQRHQQSRAQNELMNSGLYLVLLLHLYEQRFAELMRLNFGAAGRQRLSRHCPQSRPEENESAEVGDENGV
ncbi:probable E3 ubiquitin-protein ligase MARCHF10 [Echinops telfairi]|uniref:RING-type E3 ubiquitin transferase n=1 Tax=Echinops telfairi TaxID=9371 RepID=A0ABM0ITU8_ECHTE|nr:probable E3 ubiquitin-protein ligase MARCHF10 [Echinops telfairi]